jgi:hypothetical protein
VRTKTARKPLHRAEKANQSEKPQNAEDDEMPLPENPLLENQLHRVKESRGDELRAGKVRDAKPMELSERIQVGWLLPAGRRRRHSLRQLRSQRGCWVLSSGRGENHSTCRHELSIKTFGVLSCKSRVVFDFDSQRVYHFSPSTLESDLHLAALLRAKREERGDRIL